MSLVDAILPEGFTEGTLIPNRRAGDNQKLRTANVRLAQLFFTVTIETADAILNPCFKTFDALVKNFGCQITALQNFRSLSIKDIESQAATVKQQAEACLRLCHERLNKPFIETTRMTLSQYLQAASLDIQVSSEIATLVRFRLLTIVNSNVEEGGKEVPKTNKSLLIRRIPKLEGSTISKLIDLLQVAESKRAIAFIQQEIATCNHQRSPLIQRLLGSSFVKEGASKISSAPLMYNTEAVFRCYQGVVLLKQKMKFCDKQIEGVKAEKLFLQLPEEKRILESELEKKQPMLVVEGYVKTANLAARVAEVGFFSILNANCAILNQYADGVRDFPVDDAEAVQDIASYALRKELVEDTFDIDHIYCASVGEEQ